MPNQPQSRHIWSMEVRSHIFSDINIKQMSTVTVYFLMASIPGEKNQMTPKWLRPVHSITRTPEHMIYYFKHSHTKQEGRETIWKASEIVLFTKIIS
jgi:hypothetical protein